MKSRTARIIKAAQTHRGIFTKKKFAASRKLVANALKRRRAIDKGSAIRLHANHIKSMDRKARQKLTLAIPKRYGF